MYEKKLSISNNFFIFVQNLIEYNMFECVLPHYGYRYYDIIFQTLTVPMLTIPLYISTLSKHTRVLWSIGTVNDRKNLSTITIKFIYIHDECFYSFKKHEFRHIIKTLRNWDSNDREVAPTVCTFILLSVYFLRIV